jgi:Transposase family tnp2
MENETYLDTSFDPISYQSTLQDQLEAQKREDEYLYAGVDLTIKDATIMLSKYFHHLNLSYDALAVTIKLIRTFIPFEENKQKFDVSTAKLNKMFTQRNDINIDYFCRGCKKLLNGKDERCTNCENSTIGEFIHMQLENQLRTLLGRHDIREAILLREPNDDNLSVISSIRDGKIYKEMGEFLKNPNNFSMSYYTDGVAVTNSTNLSVWPIYLNILELPRSIRYKIENTILLGLWYDKTKPDFNTYFQPTVPILQSLKNDGIDIHYVKNKELATTNMKGVLICGFADAPARAAELQTAQYNGHYGCNNCTQDPICLNTIFETGDQNKAIETTDSSKTTKSNDVAKNKSKQKRKAQNTSEPASSSKNSKFPNSTQLVYEYQEDLTLRTTRASIQLARRAEASGIAEMGIKRLTILYFIVYNAIESMGIDPMHCVFGGVVKKLIELWFDKRYKDYKFSMYKKLKEVDKLMLSIKTPNFFTRRPKSIETQISFFTTAEFKNFCFYISIPILKTIEMDKTRFHHYAMLVEAVYILHKDEITKEEIIIATNFLDQFVKDFAVLYGIEFMSYNVHSLLHLGNYVRNLGPLYESSCFPLEALNGVIKRWVKGSRYAHLKIAKFVIFAQTLPLHIQELPKNSSAREFIEMLDKSSRDLILDIIDERSCALGRYFNCNEARWLKIQSAHHTSEISKSCFSSKNEVKIFLRLRRNKILYSSIANKGTKKTASYCIEYGLKSDIGLVEFFFKVNNYCDCDSVCSCKANYFALVKQCEQVKVDSVFRDNFMVKKLSKLLTFEIVNISDINQMCAYCALGVDNYYCTRKVNTKESE